MIPSEKNVLVIDDDKRSREALVRALLRTGYTVFEASSGVAGLTYLENEDIHLVLSDLRMPGMDGISVLEAVKRNDANIQVILLTGHGSIESTVEAMHKGAFTYLTKPANLSELRLQVQRALEHQHLSLEVQSLRKLKQKTSLGRFVGDSASIQAVFDAVRDVAPTQATVLIVGESGCGKELVAQAIHQNSPRKERAFVPVNCAAIPEALLESELFGYERGAFTGAERRREGLFEQANGGTLFLDEVGDMPLTIQVKLLRILEQRVFLRLGGTSAVETDVRILAATHIDLEKAVAEGRFREDLYYRLNVVKVFIPALRDRKQDIPLMVEQFVNEFAQIHNKAMPEITQEALDILVAYDWPGNVRELRNCLESLIIRMKTTTLSVDLLPVRIKGEQEAPKRVDVFVGMSMDEVERRMIENTLSDVHGNQTRAARVLNIGLRTLQRKLKKYGLL
jgi:two-component system response regulator HydG